METTVVKKQIDTLPGSFFLTDEKAVIVYANQAVEPQSGYAEPEAVGKKPQELWGGQMKTAFYRDMWRTLLAHDWFVGDVVNKRKDGAVVKERIHLGKVADQATRSTYFFALNPRGADDSFSDEFARIMSSRQGQTDAMVEWMLDRLAPGAAFRSEGQSLHRFLSIHIAAPAREQYAYRDIDRKLVENAKQDPNLFDALYEKYYDAVFDYFFYRVGHASGLAHDLAQDTFLRAFRALEHFELKNATYFTYMQRIAHNVLVNHYRKRRPDSLEALSVQIADAPKSIDPLLQKERLWRAAESLSEIERDILVMKYKEAYSVREIAGMLQKTENAVKLHLSRARKKLRSILDV